MLTHKGTATLQSERLLLRRATLDDAQSIFDNWANDPEVTKYLTWPPHTNPEATVAVLQDWVKQYAKPNYYHWMIVLKDNGDKPIGSLIAVSEDDRIGKFHIGYCIGKNWWHRGIMSEVLTTVMKFLFEEVGANRIEARHASENPRSGAVMKKCGMQYEGTARQADRNNQGICDSCNYAILFEDWKKK